MVEQHLVWRQAVVNIMGRIWNKNIRMTLLFGVVEIKPD